MVFKPTRVYTSFIVFGGVYQFTRLPFGLKRQIFMRLRQHHLFLIASKCYFDNTELEFVGKGISESGFQMSQEQIRSVLDFPVPSISKQLKSFLGLTNYFHDFIRNHSAIVKPLNSMSSNYSKTKS
jgi:hypothetical protein